MTSVRITSVALAVCIAALPMAPPIHVHEVAASGHHERLVHSHGEAHHVHSEDAGAGSAFTDQDTVVLTFDPVFALPHASLVLAPPVSTAALVLEPPAEQLLVSISFVEPLIHGPPRAPAVPRGPPSSSLL